MLRMGRTGDGRQIVSGNMKDLKALNDWTQAMCHACWGPQQGERKYRNMTLLAVAGLWAKMAEAEGR